MQSIAASVAHCTIVEAAPLNVSAKYCDDVEVMVIFSLAIDEK